MYVTSDESLWARGEREKVGEKGEKLPVNLAIHKACPPSSKIREKLRDTSEKITNQNHNLET